VPWSASARVCSNGFPLEVIPLVSDRRIKGFATGDAAVTSLHEDARAQAKLTLSHLVVGDVAFANGRVDVTVDQRRLRANVRLDQKDGFVDAKASLGTRWGGAMAPSADRTQPADMTVTARRFRLAAALPFTQDIFSDLDGRADADARL